MPTRTVRGLIIGYDETTQRGKVSLYGKGVHEFPPEVFLYDRPAQLAEVVEVDFEEDQVVKVRPVNKTMQDHLRTLTPEELAVIRVPSKKEMHAILERGRKEAQRERQARRQMAQFRHIREDDPKQLLAAIKALEKRLTNLEDIVALTHTQDQIPLGTQGTTDGSTISSPAIERARRVLDEIADGRRPVPQVHSEGSRYYVSMDRPGDGDGS